MKERLRQKNLSELQEEVLKILANHDNCSVSVISKLIGKSASHISHVLRELENLRLLKRTKKGKNVYVCPIFDVVIAYKK
jgi:uncharacterized membrane protein